MTFEAKATPAGRLVDTDTKLSAGILPEIRSAGYQGIIRYVPLPKNNPAGDIDATELEAILDAGFGLMLVQHPRYEGWNPGAESGAADADTAILYATAAGYIRGAHIFLDLEGVAATATAAATIAFANAWAAAIVAAEYLAGCYVGFDVPLSAQQLYDLPDVNSYWSDPGPREVAVRGFAMKQQAEVSIGGLPFDPDVVKADLLGQTPIWMYSATGSAV